MNSRKYATIRHKNCHEWLVAYAASHFWMAAFRGPRTYSSWDTYSYKDERGYYTSIYIYE